MRRRSLSRIDKWIDSIDNRLSTTKAQHSEALVAAELGHSLREGREEKGRDEHRGCDTKIWAVNAPKEKVRKN
jgi:hypothetical protein